jgi:KDO2-lipid IV(A) lauroyltransferase
MLTWCERLPISEGFCMHMQPLNAPELSDPKTTPEAAAAVVNRAVETMVLNAPGQYLWGYPRDKHPCAEGWAWAPSLVCGC